jgi:hypothetical protein
MQKVKQVFKGVLWSALVASTIAAAILVVQFARLDS